MTLESLQLNQKIISFTKHFLVYITGKFVVEINLNQTLKLTKITF